MIPLSIALGVVGLAAVLAAWDAMRRAIGLGAAETRLKALIESWADTRESEHAKLRQEIEARTAAAETTVGELHKDLRALKDQAWARR